MIFILLYVGLIAYYCYAWQSFVPASKANTMADPSLEVVILIPFKNEADNLPLLIEDINNQIHQSPNCRFVFINDHSTDNSVEIINTYSHLQVIDNLGKGKKAGLITGIEATASELIITLDADCSIGPMWLSTILLSYQQSVSNLLILPVGMRDNGTLWGRVQCVEFQSLVASTAASAMGNHAIMCNGANLAYQRKLVQNPSEVLNMEYASGDDMFLLDHAKKINANISYVKSKEAMATIAPETWKHFWRQRMRWSTKSPGYKDVEIITIGLLVLFANLTLLVLPFINSQVALVTFILKALVDVVFLYMTASFWDTKKYVYLSLFITPLYPVYVMVSVIGAVFSKAWK